ncbi:uncharacterized protein LOC141714012 [Apium graveolens]|uniref:uncharacterized protein LOC141714012 n=1 Tax=Apium graveolens TaxID=4045 RepID=UPI003D793414
MKETESVEDYFNRVVSISNQLMVNGEELKDQRIIEKILRSMSKKYEHIVVAIDESKNLSELPLESLLGSLQSHELRIKQFESSPSEQAFQMQEFHREGFRGRGRGRNFCEKGRSQPDSYARGRSQARNYQYQLNHEASPGNQYERGRFHGQVGGRGRGNYQSQIQCNFCHKFGHLKKDCYSRLKYERNETSFLHESSESKNEEYVLLMFNEQEVSTKNIWYIDSGCSHHMTGHKSILINLDEFVQREVKTGDNKRHLVQGCGYVTIQTK